VTSLSDSLWQVISVLVYRSRIYKGIITVPEGFVTDFASVPRVPLVYFAFGNRAHHESVIHDYIYQTHLTSKAKADRIFLEAMKARGKPLWIRWGMYLGVILGGRKAYKSGLERYKVLQSISQTTE